MAKRNTKHDPQMVEICVKAGQAFANPEWIASVLDITKGHAGKIAREGTNRIDHIKKLEAAAELEGGDAPDNS